MMGQAPAGGLQSSSGYERLDDNEEGTPVEPFTLWAKRKILKPMNLFLVALFFIAGLILCILHPWEQKHKIRHSILLHTQYEGAELFEYAEYTFGMNASLTLNNGTLDLTIWEIVTPYLEQALIDCPDEPYTITPDGATSIIKLTREKSKKDCIYKAIHATLPKKLKMALSDEMMYNTYTEEITMHFTILDLVVFDVRMLPNTNSPTLSPTSSPTRYPTMKQPTKSPTGIPTLKPTTQSPSHYPTTLSPTSNMTTGAPTKKPTRSPTMSPTNTKAPSTGIPTAQPTKSPKLPTFAPSTGDVPIGFYEGQKKVFGYVVDANMRFDKPGICGIQIVIDAAHVNVTCSNEEYTMNGNSVELSNVDNKGDCIHDQMPDDVSLKSITYSKNSNKVTVNVKYYITESIELAHKNE